MRPNQICDISAGEWVSKAIAIAFGCRPCHLAELGSEVDRVRKAHP